MRTLLALLLTGMTAFGATYYASPTGTDGAAGTLAAPLSLRVAFGSTGFTSPASAGDTIYLRGGIYYTTNSNSGDYKMYSNLKGTLVAPIVVKAYGTEWPVLDNTKADNTTGISISGSNTWYIGFEVRNSSTTRGGAGNFRPTGIDVHAPGTRIINCVIHDTGVGITTGEEATGAWLYGNVIYNCGDDQSPLKHSIYAYANGGASNPTIIKNNISLNSSSMGIHCFSDFAGYVNGYQIIGNTAAQAGTLLNQYTSDILVGAESGGTAGLKADNFLMADNLTYNAGHYYYAWDLGYQSGGHTNGTAVITNNYAYGNEWNIYQWTNLTFRSNTFINNRSWGWEYYYAGSPTVDWDYNTFHNPNISDLFLINGTLPTLTWAGWKAATGFDSHSTKSNSNPTSTVSFVRTNQFDAGRMNITVYNWAGTSNVTVDLSSYLRPGSAYTVKHAAAPLGAVLASGTYTTGSITLPMTNLPIAAPVGMTAPVTTEPQFAAFVLQSSIGASVHSGTIRSATLH